MTKHSDHCHNHLRQRTKKEGLETPRWVFFTTITIFLLTNYLLDASPCYHLSPQALPWLCRPQWVIKTHWWPLPQPYKPLPAPTSCNDLFVPFFAFPSTMQATPSTNKPIWLIGCFFHLSLDHASHNEHQRVIKTHWWLLPWPHRLHQAPTSPYDSLVPFSASPSTMQATTSTNESLWLIGSFFSYPSTTLATMACWCIFLLLPWSCRPHQAPISPYGWLVAFSPLPWPHQPQQAPMSCIDSLVAFFHLYHNHHYNFTSSSYKV